MEKMIMYLIQKSADITYRAISFLHYLLLISLYVTHTQTYIYMNM